MGIFFKEDGSKDYPKTKVFTTIQWVFVIGIIICTLLSFIRSEASLAGFACILLCVIFALDGLHMYQATGKWEKRNVYPFFLFFLTGILLIS